MNNTSKAVNGYIEALTTSEDESEISSVDLVKVFSNYF